jgi:hypothetical protein
LSSRALSALLALAFVMVSPQRVEADGAQARAEITLVGETEASASVKEVVVELLARDRASVVWITRKQFQPRDIFDRRVTWGVAAWIDLSASAEARLYFRDASADRFFIRALPLARGIDEIAKEEIAHIVSNAVSALHQGSGETLTRSEAREALHLRPASEEEPEPAAPSLPLRFTLAALAGAQLLAADLPVVAKGALSFALTRGPAWNRVGGSFGAWLDLGYQLPGHYRGTAVGADVQAFGARVGMLWEIERGVLWRFGAGAGVDRIHYQPKGDGDHVALASASSFIVPVMAFWAGFDLRLLDGLALTSRISVDTALVKVHFDLHERGGQTTRVLVPYPVLPAAFLGLTLVF